MWEGILRFGSINRTFYLVADTRDVSPKMINALEKTLLSGRFEGYLSDSPTRKAQSSDRALFELDLSEFNFGDRMDGENLFRYSDISALIELLKLEYKPNDNSSTNGSDLEKMLTLTSRAMTAEHVTITQYGKGTGADLIPLNLAVIVESKQLESPLGIRGTCQLGDRGKMKFGQHEAFFSRYSCRKGKKDIDGAVFAIQIAENIFKIEYEVAGRTASEINKLENTLSKIRLKEK